MTREKSPNTMHHRVETRVGDDTYHNLVSLSKEADRTFSDYARKVLEAHARRGKVLGSSDLDPIPNRASTRLLIDLARARDKNAYVFLYDSNGTAYRNVSYRFHETVSDESNMCEGAPSDLDTVDIVAVSVVCRHGHETIVASSVQEMISKLSKSEEVG